MLGKEKEMGEKFKKFIVIVHGRRRSNQFKVQSQFKVHKYVSKKETIKSVQSSKSELADHETYLI